MVAQPFRWDLVTRDQLGTLLEGTPAPSLWYLDALVVCAAKILARSADGRLVFVGRSADSIFDLLSGAFAGSAFAARLDRLPFSYRGDPSWLSRDEIRDARELLRRCDVSPAAMASAERPIVLVDLVHDAYTFTNLYRLVRAWSDEEKRRWASTRHNLRFLGVTVRGKTSPKTWRWHQHYEWVGELAPRSVSNVSLDDDVWRYLGNDQPKVTRTFGPESWAAPHADGPRHDDITRAGLAEAVALVTAGRSRDVRLAMRRVLLREPAVARPWLRAIISALR